MKIATQFIVRFSLLLLLFAPLCGVRAQQQTDVPRRGEGITTFLQRHGRSPKLYYDDFVELNRKKLRGSEELRLGVSYIVPPLKDASSTSASKKKNSRRGKSVREPLLGKRFRDVAVTSDRLAGTCFYLVSGHGGPDPGAIGRVGRHELHEDEYAYDIILRLARYLLSEGAEVRIIIQDAKDGIRGDAYLSNSKRETCMGDPIPLNQVARSSVVTKSMPFMLKTASATNIAVPSLSMSIVKGVASRWMFISTMRQEAGRESGWPMPCVPPSRPSMAFISPAVALRGR